VAVVVVPIPLLVLRVETVVLEEVEVAIVVELLEQEYLDKAIVEDWVFQVLVAVEEEKELLAETAMAAVELVALEELEGLTGQVTAMAFKAAWAGQVLLDLILELAEEILA
jgi:hypothetical protein